jgi:hypothetical protein
VIDSGRPKKSFTGDRMKPGACDAPCLSIQVFERHGFGRASIVERARKIFAMIREIGLAYSSAQRELE